jgi:hypothetical protein
MNTKPIKPTYEELAKRGRVLVAIHKLANTYAVTVGAEIKALQQRELTKDEYHAYFDGVKQMLDKVHKRTPIDFAMLERYPPRALCQTLNEALEHMVHTGAFKEGWKPEWVS